MNTTKMFRDLKELTEEVSHIRIGNWRRVFEIPAYLPSPQSEFFRMGIANITKSYKANKNGVLYRVGELRQHKKECPPNGSSPENHCNCSENGSILYTLSSAVADGTDYIREPIRTYVGGEQFNPAFGRIIKDFLFNLEKRINAQPPKVLFTVTFNGSVPL